MLKSCTARRGRHVRISRLNTSVSAGRDSYHCSSWPILVWSSGLSSHEIKQSLRGERLRTWIEITHPDRKLSWNKGWVRVWMIHSKFCGLPNFRVKCWNFYLVEVLASSKDQLIGGLKILMSLRMSLPHVMLRSLSRLKTVEFPQIFPQTFSERRFLRCDSICRIAPVYLSVPLIPFLICIWWHMSVKSCAMMTDGTYWHCDQLGQQIRGHVDQSEDTATNLRTCWPVRSLFTSTDHLILF